MIKLISKNSVNTKSHPWLHWTRFTISSNDESRETVINAGISGEDLLEFLEWSQETNEKSPGEKQLDKWRDSVIKKFLDELETCNSKVCFYSHKENKGVLNFLKRQP